MNSQILYTNNGSLEKQIRSKKIIPYMVYPNEKFKVNKWYYNQFYNEIFKVLEVKYNEDGSLDYANIMTDSNNYSMISTDICYSEDYAISRDRRSIYKMNIINYNESFTGAEIIYWFFMNDINAFNKKYHGFWKYVDRYSLHRISDRERYYVKAQLIGNKYVNCTMERDNTAEIHTKIILGKIKDSESDKFMAELKKKDMKRMKKKHKRDL